MRLGEHELGEIDILSRELAHEIDVLPAELHYTMDRDIGIRKIPIRGRS